MVLFMETLIRNFACLAQIIFLVCLSMVFIYAHMEDMYALYVCVVALSCTMPRLYLTNVKVKLYLIFTSLGFCIGGSMGQTKEELTEMMGWVMPNLPKDR